MSQIYFSSPGGRVRLSGSERAHMGLLAANLTYGAFHPTGWEDDPLFRVTHFQSKDYAGFGSALRFHQDFLTFLRTGGDRPFRLPGRETSEQPRVLAVCLNTALALGGDPLRLMARLHGQCEIHAWVDGPDRSWLAEIIDQGRAVGLMRPKQGWEGVAAFLRRSNSEPVVTSYSVTDDFPNPRVAGYTDDQDGDTWFDLAEADRWERAMQRLRAPAPGLEGLQMRPDLWSFPDFSFGTGATAFSITEAALAEAGAPEASAGR